MRKAQILLFLGVWITILPYLGFPYSWQDVLTSLTGLVFIYLSYFLYKNSIVTEHKERTFDNFRENKNFNETKNISNDYSNIKSEESEDPILEQEEISQI